MIAGEAGVSRETVSHILGGKHATRYRQSTQDKVIGIAQRLRYLPHRGAQIMKTGRSNLIAIVHFGAGVEAAHTANLALSRKVSEVGYDYLAVDMNWYGGSVERTIAELIRARVEGVLISHIQEVFKSSHIDELTGAGIPVVAVNGEQRSNVPLVCDNVIGAFNALTTHLIEIGHRVILQLVSQHQDGTLARSLSHRTKGFRLAVKERGQWSKLTEEAFFEVWPVTPPAGKAVSGITIEQDERLYRTLDRPVYQFCKRLFQRGGGLPDAIVCANDLFAMEVIAAALEHGIQVPGDLAVTGYDNDRIGAFPSFGITTAEQDIEGICAKAVEILTRQIAKSPVGAKPVFFDSAIVLRTSSGKAGSRAA
jgi:DNA-binding LacI/PurR family transcriptional regulator